MKNPSILFRGPAYAVMFGAGPPARHQAAAVAKFQRTTLAYMGARSHQAAARELRIRFVGAHCRAPYSRLVTGDRDTLSPGEARGATEWTDWAALAPEFWLGPVRQPFAPERDMMFDMSRKAIWPYRLICALEQIYGEEAFKGGIFLDADVYELRDELEEAREMLQRLGLHVYLNGGRFKQEPRDWILEWDGIFMEAVLHGTPDAQRGMELAVELMTKTAGSMESFWTGIQYRFVRPPSDDEIRRACEWFLSNRRSGTQTITFFVDAGSQRCELPCPDALDPDVFCPIEVTRHEALDSEIP